MRPLCGADFKKAAMPFQPMNPLCFRAVDDFVAANAANSQEIPQLSTNSLQLIEIQWLRNQ
jgi:hypothetical protein